MKVSSALLGIALIGITITGVVFHFWREPEEGRQQNAVVASKLPERQPPIAALPVPTPAQTSTVPDEPLHAATASQQVANPDNSAYIPAGTDANSLFKRLQTPEGKALVRSVMRPAAASSFPDLEQALGLTTAEADRLLDLFTEQRVRGATTVHPEESAQDRETRQRKEVEGDAAELQALLGSKYSKWQDYQETRFTWQERHDLRAVLDAASIPLSQTQDEALINALSAEHRIINQTRPSGSLFGHSARYTPENRQRLLDAVTPYLSPQQLDGYKGVLERTGNKEQRMLSLEQRSPH